MPDLTHQGYWQCASVEQFSTKVRGTLGTYTVSIQPSGETTDNSWHCTCDAFKYARLYKSGAGSFKPACKHIQEIERAKKRCGWLQFFDGGAVVEAKADDGTVTYYCPKCGDIAVARIWAV